MIRVSPMYRKKKNGKFDWEYYLTKHLPLVRKRLGNALQNAEAFRGVAGMNGQAAPYECVCHLYFDSMEAFQEAFGPVADEVLGDIKNFTNLDVEVNIEAMAV